MIWHEKFVFNFSLRGRVELLKYVYFCAQKSIIKAVNNKFQDLINAPRMHCSKGGGCESSQNNCFKIHPWSNHMHKRMNSCTSLCNIM